MQEYRCKFCHKLLFKYRINGTLPLERIDSFIEKDGELAIEVKCDKCKKVNIAKTDDLRVAITV